MSRQTRVSMQWKDRRGGVSPNQGPCKRWIWITVCRRSCSRSPVLRGSPGRFVSLGSPQPPKCHLHPGFVHGRQLWDFSHGNTQAKRHFVNLLLLPVDTPELAGYLQRRCWIYCHYLYLRILQEILLLTLNLYTWLCQQGNRFLPSKNIVK